MSALLDHGSYGSRYVTLRMKKLGKIRASRQNACATRFEPKAESRWLIALQKLLVSYWFQVLPKHLKTSRASFQGRFKSDAMSSGSEIACP